MMPTRTRLIVSLLMPALVFAAPARAAIVTTDQAVAPASSQAVRGRIASALDRPEAASALERFGVSKRDAQDRIAALTDEEAAVLASHLDSAPAGGDFFATLGLIVVLLVVTDLLGVTDIFPFINSVR